MAGFIFLLPHLDSTVAVASPANDVDTKSNARLPKTVRSIPEFGFQKVHGLKHKRH
jgi:hypothetical protein